MPTEHIEQAVAPVPDEKVFGGQLTHSERVNWFEYDPPEQETQVPPT
jgi:hypothetical protein